MKKVLTATVKYMNLTVFLIGAGFQTDHFIDTDGNVWNASEIDITGWSNWNGVTNFNPL